MRSRIKNAGGKTKSFMDNNDVDTCTYCGVRVFVFAVEGSLGLLATIDHDLPKCRMGPEKQGNERLCCLSCNQAKADMTSEEYLHFLEHRKFHPDYIEFLEERAFQRVARFQRLLERGRARIA